MGDHKCGVLVQNAGSQLVLDVGRPWGLAGISIRTQSPERYLQLPVEWAGHVHR